MFRILFHEPRIAGNTGAAIRLAAVTGSELHLVEPLGFDLEESKLRRAGLDYHDLAVMSVHPDLDAAFDTMPDSAVYAFTAHGEQIYSDIAYQPGDVLLFGTEPTGLPGEVLNHPRVTARVKLPMLPARRSMNLTNTASVAVYEAWRQHGFAV